MTAQLTWNPGFGPQRSRKFQDRRASSTAGAAAGFAFVPFQTGMLDRSGMLGTRSPRVRWCYVAPYAAAQYYGTADSRDYDAHRAGTGSSA